MFGATLRGRPVVGGPSVCLSSSCLLHLPLARTLALCAATGFDGVELVMSPEVWLRGVGFVGRACERLGLRVCSVHTSIYGARPGSRGASQVAEAADAAVALGSPVVVVHYPMRAPAPAERDSAWLAGVQRARDRLAPTGGRLALENQGTFFGRDPVCYLEGLAHLARLATRLDVHLTLDTCHTGRAGPLLLDALGVVRPRLAHVHLSDFRLDAPLGDVMFLGGWSAQHQLPGAGDLPLVRFLGDLGASGYAGAVVLEVGPWNLRAWSGRALRRTLRWASGWIRGALAGGGRGD